MIYLPKLDPPNTTPKREKYANYQVLSGKCTFMGTWRV